MTVRRSEVPSSISLTPHKSHGDDVHKELKMQTSATEMLRGKQCEILTLFQIYTLPKKRAYFSTLPALDTNMNSIYGMAPNIV